MTTPWLWLTGVGLGAAGAALRVWAHRGDRPVDLDTWYYLAYARAVRRRPGFEVRLPQYLLQAERESYPPLFPTLLALAPAGWLRRHSWWVPSLFDGAHVALLFWATAAATGSGVVGSVAALALVFTPRSMTEPGSLHGRSFGLLLHSMATLLALQSVSRDGPWPWLASALLAGAGLYLASAAMSAAYTVVLATLSLLFLNERYLIVACGAVVLAILASGGHYLRVVVNYGHALRYGLRNHRLLGAHPIRHSPLYGVEHVASRPVPLPRGLLGHTKLAQLLRVVGENPLVLALAFATPRSAAQPTDAWAGILVALALTATLLPPLRAFGLERNHMRAAVFPTAHALGLGIGSPGGLLTPVGFATLACLAVSVTVTVVLYVDRRRRRDRAAPSPPDGLEQALRRLVALPPGAVLCLPYAYSGYVSYHAERAVLWGGHSGDLRRWEALAPVIARGIPELMSEYGVRYLLCEDSYAAPSDIGLEEGVQLEGRWGRFALYRRAGDQ